MRSVYLSMANNNTTGKTLITGFTRPENVFMYVCTYVRMCMYEKGFMR